MQADDSTRGGVLELKYYGQVRDCDLIFLENNFLKCDITNSRGSFINVWNVWDNKICIFLLLLFYFFQYMNGV